MFQSSQSVSLKLDLDYKITIFGVNDEIILTVLCVNHQNFSIFATLFIATDANSNQQK
jgi:hypothetical protein